ncbi:adenosylmethionine decarboxylase [Saccharophagus degradans]|uniref:S-adenosylmethionine decarboxylase proenzyme n=1 Tax=Saccharophagus degradans (strain 2-40 / ATCC 43961 / DSM 17024) TaxID=203122 RepID=Q21LE6_SACD2|nr:adenosylmethionine decarboxylase [Saccharophagus degradans]ABD80483.1 S-adenosylmethionine decarboxylase related [Saccharophagus degradans 2-40]
MIDVKTSQSYQEPQSTESSLVQSDTAGRHFIVDFWGAHYLENVDVLEQALTDAASVAGAVLLHIHLHKFTQGGGVTGVALLAESHISVHTWPERDYAAFDVFMCGDAKPQDAVALLERVFKPTKTKISEILRGKE